MIILIQTRPPFNSDKSATATDLSVFRKCDSERSTAQRSQLSKRGYVCMAFLRSLPILDHREAEA